MKIDQAMACLEDVMEILREEGMHGCRRNIQLAKEALEQHHKDLMVLVEAWRKKSRDTVEVPYAWALMHCADQIESLINPKD